MIATNISAPDFELNSTPDQKLKLSELLGKKVILAFFPAFLLAQDKQVKGFVINGNISGLSDGEARLTTTQENQINIALGTMKQGVFTLQGSIPEPGLYYLILANEQPIYIYLENNPIKITGTKADIKNIKVEGSQSHKDFLEFNKIFNPLIGELNVYAAQIQKENNERKKEELLKKYESVESKINIEVGKFVANKKSSYLSPFLLWVTAKINNDFIVMEQRYNMLDENIRNTQIGKSLKDFIAYNKVGAVGTDAVDFTQNDVNGNPVTLSSFKGKYVLVDFWASWCRPCRAENPAVVKAYNKFKSKNFTILGVSLDQEKAAWVKAIENDKLTWNQVSDLQQWNNAVAQLYRIQSIPGNLLIDPNGKIIARDLRGSQLEKKLCELLGGCN